MNLNNSLPLALSFDDVSIGVAHTTSPVRHREDVDLTQTLFEENPGSWDKIALESPIISASMDTVTESEMAQALYEAGGVGILHRHTDDNEVNVENVIDEIESVDGIVGASIGLDGTPVENAVQYVNAGADFISVEVPHANMEAVCTMIRDLREELPNTPIMAGNIDSGAAAKNLINAGVNSVKVGIGPGSACRTREKTGVGTPQFTAIRDVVNTVNNIEMLESTNVSVVADGGLTESGDISKALLAGANAVMTGRLLVGCPESPASRVTINDREWVEYRGLASKKFREENDSVTEDPTRFVEGGSGLVEPTSPVGERVDELLDGTRSACSFCSGHTLEEARKNAQFQRVTPQSDARKGVHSITQNK